MGLRKLVSELLREKWLLCKLGSTAKQQQQRKSTSCSGHPSTIAAANHLRNQWQSPFKTHGTPGPSVLLRQLHQARAYSAPASTARNLLFPQLFPSYAHSAGLANGVTGRARSAFASAWSRQWMARALGVSAIGAALMTAAPSPLLQLLRIRMSHFIQHAIRMQQCPMQRAALQLFHCARYRSPMVSPFAYANGRVGMAGMPRWGAQMHQECIMARWAFARRAALSRGYATAISRCAPFPPPVQVFATSTGRMFTMPLACLNTKMMAPLQNADLKDEDESGSQRMMATYTKARSPRHLHKQPRSPVKHTSPTAHFAREHRPLPSRRVAELIKQDNAVLQPSKVSAVSLPQTGKTVPTAVKEEIADTIVVPQMPAQTAPQSLPPKEEAAPKVEVRPVMRDEGTQTDLAPEPEAPTATAPAPVCDVPQNTRFCVAFVLPSPQLYDHLLAEPNTSNSSSSSNGSTGHGSVVNDLLLDRLSDVMALNNYQFSLVSRAISLLRAQFPRLDVRMNDNYMRVFIPLGTPVAMVRHWLYQAGLREGEQFVFESTASLRDGSSRLNSASNSHSNHSHSSHTSKLPTYSLSAARSSVSRPRDIHSFLAKADAMARDHTGSFSRTAVHGRSPAVCSAAERLAAARDYSQTKMSFL